MSGTTTLDWLAQEITQRKHSGRPLKVGIDGRCGAGKTMLADALAPRLRRHGFEVFRPSVDGFHHPRAHRYRQGEYSAAGYYEDAFDYAAIVADFLRPLSGSAFPAMCRQASHDLRQDVPIETRVPISANAVLLFDGIFLFRRQLNPYWDVRVLLQVDAATSMTRAVQRDTEATGSSDIIRRKYEVRYEPAWQMYCDLEQPEIRADLVVDNNDVEDPIVLKGSGPVRG